MQRHIKPFKYILFILLVVFTFSCKRIDSEDAIKIVAQAYKDYVLSAERKYNLYNIPQYRILLPDFQDELAIELVPYLKKALIKNRLSGKHFSIAISKALTDHSLSLKLEVKIKKTNQYFQGDMFGIIKRSVEYLRRGLPTLSSDKPGEINNFNFESLSLAIKKLHRMWKSQDFATLFFMHNENDREKFDKIHKDLKKNIWSLVKVARRLNISGLKLYRMDFLRYYELLMTDISRQIEYSFSPAIKKLHEEYFFFLNKNTAKGKYKLAFPDLSSNSPALMLFNPPGNIFKAVFSNNVSLDFKKEGKYWRLPDLPKDFWKLPEISTSGR
jgi:hypothetical protein